MFGYVYLTTNLLNNKKYIGRKTSKTFVPSYFGSGPHIKNAVKKYGKENFNVTILKECFDYEDMVLSEMFYIKLYDAVKSDEYYNESYGGFNEGFTPGEDNISKRPEMRKINSEKHKGKKMSEEFKEKQRIIHLGKPSGMLGHKQSERVQKICSEATTKYNLERKDYNQLSNHHKGSKMMTNGTEQHWIYKENIQEMLDKGWYFGSCFKRKKKEQTEKLLNSYKSKGKSLRNTLWVHKDNEKHQISKDKLEQYLDMGYLLGMKDK